MSPYHDTPPEAPDPPSERRLGQGDPGWRLRMGRPGRWYALDLRTGVSIALPYTLSLLEAVRAFDRLRVRIGPAASA